MARLSRHKYTYSRKTERPIPYETIAHFRFVQKIIQYGNVRKLRKPIKPVQLDDLLVLGLTGDMW